ncbi:MAG: transposase [Dehalococcoidia bacterium]
MAQGRKTSLVITVTAEERRILEIWQRSTTIQAGLAKRSRMILMLSEGNSISQVSRTISIRRRHIYKWANRFLEQRIAGLLEQSGRGRKQTVPSTALPSEIPSEQLPSQRLPGKTGLISTGGKLLEDAGNEQRPIDRAAEPVTTKENTAATPR